MYQSDLIKICNMLIELKDIKKENQENTDEINQMIMKAINEIPKAEL